MASENLVRFGYIEKSDIQKALDEGLLSSWSVIYTSDTHQQFLVDENKELVTIKSQVPIYGSADAAIESIKIDGSAYEGEIISIYNALDECFDAYVCNKWPNGDWYVKPINTKEDVDYNRINNIPIVNIESSVVNPVDLTTLPDGYYKVNYFISPSSGNQINSIVGNLFVIESNLDTKVIKRISASNIFEYQIKGDKVTTKKYVTDTWLKENNYMTETDVDDKFQAFDVIVQQRIEDYVANTCVYLIKYILDQELAARNASKADIESMFSM